MSEDDDLRAAEYVLGTLDAAARAAFERAWPDDSALQAAVYAWQDRLLGLAARATPAEPRAGAWAAIEARLAPPAAANDAVWQRVRRWQWASAAGLAASLVLAALLVLQARAPTVRYLAVLQAPSDKSDGWVVEATAGGAVRLVPIGVTPPVPAGKTLQFWTKAEGAAGPTSLGLVHAGQAVELPVSRLPALGVRQLFELTLEPEAGSPIGRPTGPVLFVGRSVQL